MLLSFVKVFLYPFALIYGAIVWLRNRLYESGFFSSVEFSVPVISVGNLSVGGTGKTPHVEYLIRLLQYQYKVATMSRGYKRRTQGFLLADASANAVRIGDEPMQYFIKFPEAIVSVAEERMTGIPSLLQRVPDIDVVLLDDAYQHRSVQPGLNILITDFSHPYYEDHILPYGRLREPVSAAQRADIIIVSKCPSDLTLKEAQTLRGKFQPLAHQHLFFTELVYGAPFHLFTEEEGSFAGKNVLLVCGIANPQNLQEYVARFAHSIHLLSYPDHHYFLSKDLEEIAETFRNWDVPHKVILTTEKDATRLRLQADKLNALDSPLLVLPVQVRFLFEQGNKFDQLVFEYVEPAVMEHREHDWSAPSNGCPGC